MDKDIKKNLYEYIYSSRPEYQEYIEFLEYEIHERVYYYGNQFKNHRDNKTFLDKISFFFKHLKIITYVFFGYLLNKKNISKNSGLSSSSMNYDEKLENKDLIIYRSPWSPKRGRPMNVSLNDYLRFMRMEYRLYFYSTFNLTSTKNLKYIKEFKSFFKGYIRKNKYSFLLVPEDLNFWSRIAITIFKELDMPSISMAHGWLPDQYVGVSDSKVSHTAKWGQFEKEAYIKGSYDQKNISITGHPLYKLENKNLRFSFNNILVLSKSMAGVVLAKEKFIEDRGNTIMYLMSIENVLRNLGVKNVFLRPHPCEAFNWYKNFINTDFFIEDKEELLKSLKSKTLVIGPKSSAMIDSIASGVNYVIYEPIINNKDILGGPISYPLDGSIEEMPVAKNIDELNKILINKEAINRKIFSKISKTTFDRDFLDRIL